MRPPWQFTGGALILTAMLVFAWAGQPAQATSFGREMTLPAPAAAYP